MTVRIDEVYKDQVLAATDIVAVIGERVELRRAGAEWVGLCPFHADKSPSLNVHPVKQVFICRGCGAGGSVVRFLMQMDLIDFRQVIENLAERAGMLPVRYKGEAPPAPPHQAIYAALEHAAAFFQAQLALTEEAQAYCHDRGFDQASISRFRIGYAPASWRALSHMLQRYPISVLHDAGLVITREDGKHYDRFRGRMMFPVLDRRGRVIGFGGRSLSDAVRPKYTNSPETAVFRKGEELYGLWQALHPGELRRARTDGGSLLVVEGYADVVSLHRHGQTQAVAALGTALSPAQTEALFSRTRDVVFCFDGDSAGRSAARRALETVLPLMTEGRSAHFLLLPEGSDPDSLIRDEGAGAFGARLKAALPLSTYLFEHYLPGARCVSVEDRTRMASALHAVVHRLPVGGYREAMLVELERRTGVSLRVERQAPLPLEPAAGVEHSLVHTACALLLANPHFGADVPVPASLASIDLPGVGLLVAMLDFVRAEPQPTTARILEHFFDSPQRRDLFLVGDVHIPSAEEAMLRQQFKQALARLMRHGDSGELRELERRVTAGGGFSCLGEHDRARFQELMERRRKEEGAKQGKTAPGLRLVSNARPPAADS